MPPHKATAAADRPRPAANTLFTIERANRALTYVRPVIADLVASYHRLLGLKTERDELLQTPGGVEQLAHVRSQIARCVADLNRLLQELSNVGCVLKDWNTGLVDFPALRDERRIWLCWRHGEPAVTHWHELHDGVSARQQIDEPPPARQTAN